MIDRERCKYPGCIREEHEGNTVHTLGKLRPGDQPLPSFQPAQVAIQDLVIADIEKRKRVGMERYGTLLKTGNGRDMLRDAYDEAMDLCVYLRGLIEERDYPPSNGAPLAQAD